MTQHNQQPLPGRAVIYRRLAHSQLPTPQPQTNDLAAFAREHGYADVSVFADGSVSGNAPMSSREALTALLTAITNSQDSQEPIRAIFTASEDRLFRDVEVRDVTAFIETCRAHRVALITPAMVYDFTDNAHVATFRFKTQEAYQFVTQVITSRLQAGKRKAAARRKAETHG